MNADRRTLVVARTLRALTTLVLVAIIGVLGYLSERHHWRTDLSASSRNSLSDTSRAVIGQLESPLQVTAWTREEGLLGQVIHELVTRYEQAGAALTLTFVNPDLEPERARDAGIDRDGLLDIGYQGRTRRVERQTERAITSAILQLSRAEARTVAYLVGHGERDLRGRANHDIGNFGFHLAERGYDLEPVNLLERGGVPENSAALVIAGPRVDLLPEEAALVHSWVEGGGNLLWLMDPGPTFGLDDLAGMLGVEVVPGTLIDPATRGFMRAGLGNPTFALVSRYGRHAALDGFNLLTVFPGTAPLAVSAPEGWNTVPLLRSGDQVWAELDELSGTVSRDAAREAAGPFDIAHAITRARDAGGEQRIVVIGDGDFLSNSALGNGGNLDLGVRFVTWLTEDDQALDIPLESDPDLTLTLSREATVVIGLGWFAVVPGLLALTGLVVWLRRRHR